MRKLIMVLSLAVLMGCKPTPKPVPPSTTDTVVVDTTLTGGAGTGGTEIESDGSTDITKRPPKT